TRNQEQVLLLISSISSGEKPDPVSTRATKSIGLGCYLTYRAFVLFFKELDCSSVLSDPWRMRGGRPRRTPFLSVRRAANACVGSGGTLANCSKYLMIRASADIQRASGIKAVPGVAIRNYAGPTSL